jgi:hypothetical protein
MFVCCLYQAPAQQHLANAVTDKPVQNLHCSCTPWPHMYSRSNDRVACCLVGTCRLRELGQVGAAGYVGSMHITCVRPSAMHLHV